MEGSGGAHEIHRLVLVHGRERARELVDPKARPLVDIAAEVMADETQRIGISYTGFCLTALPHKRLADDVPGRRRAITSRCSSNLVGCELAGVPGSSVSRTVPELE